MSKSSGQEEQWGAVLFADICDSTPLFEDTGNWLALQLIDTTLDAHAAAAEREGGTVIRSKGDDLLCTFTEAEYAAHATRAMLRISQEAEVAIRIGLHCGPYIYARDDIFGDAVNVAARLLELATPREALVTDDVRRRLCEEWQDELIAFDEHRLRGRSEVTRLYRMLPPGDNTTGIFLDAPAQSVGHFIPVQLRISYDDNHYVLEEDSPPLKVGRGDGADIKIMRKRTSRAHAIISVDDGRAVIKDRSTHGTWLQLNEHVLQIRRESFRLVGSGQIWLGDPPDETGQAPLEFSVTEKLVS